MSKKSFFVCDQPHKDDIVVTYLVTTSLNCEEASIKLCKEQSLSNALGDDEEVIKKYSAKYIPDSVRHVNETQFKVDVAYPAENCENSIAMVLSAAGGDTYNIKNLYPIKILDIKLPPTFVGNYFGPTFGVEGLREDLGIYNRPILVGPVKPCVGMGPKAFAKRAFEALLGGTDIVKDDELICSPSYSPLIQRVQAVSRSVKEAEQKTGEKKMYFAFIGSGSPKEIMAQAGIAKLNGANGFMISPAINGLEIISDLTDFGLPVIAHNALWYAGHTKDHGIVFSVFALFQRLCGADIVITPAPYGTFDVMSGAEHLENISAVSRDMDQIERSFPAFCGGQSVHTIPLLRRDVGSTDFIIVAGTSLYDHPDGPGAGAKLLRESFLSL
nr:RuBisCO long chain, Form IV [uncultured bacterium]